MRKAGRSSFVVRVVRGRRGQVSGIIERVATGAKEAFQGVEAISAVIAGMLRHEVAGRPGCAGTVRSTGETSSGRRMRPTRG